MVDVVLWIAVIGTGLCVLVYLTLLGVIILSIIGYVTGERNKNEVLPEPDPRAERTYGQKYFERAIGRKLN